MSENTPMVPVNFIRQIINEDNKTGKHGGRVATRFPPEPNGYLHIGHAKAICINFGIARDYNGTCNLRYDDTNPAKEDVEYVDAIEADVKWLGFNWSAKFYASDYFEKLYQYAIELIKMGKAYVCDLTPDQMREYRGTLTEPGKPSPSRNRSVEENLDLFARMAKGEFEEGTHTLRAKIDMSSPNINMRDPVIYRVKKAHHHRTGDKWCIYPMYDYAHCISDAIEGITHSICTLEFEDHRPLYDWCLDVLKTKNHPQQIEFSRLNLSYTVMSKRKLLELVQKKMVSGWDDPRMPTIQGFRRRGYTPESIRDFAERVGVTKKENCVDLALLENCIREDLDRKAHRRMAVLKPLKVVIENYPEGQTEEFEAPNHPSDPSQGTRKVPFAREIYIEREDFMETPPPKYYRLFPGSEVRLRFAYIVKCTGFTKDPKTGEITEVRCTYDTGSRGGNAPDGRKIKGTIHWVSVAHAVNAEVRLYDRLFKTATPDDDYKKDLNPQSLEVLPQAKLEPALIQAKAEDRFQFERQGYFVADWKECGPGKLIFNRTVTLRDTWAKISG